MDQGRDGTQFREDTHQNASQRKDPGVSSSCSRKARSQTSGRTVRPPHLPPHQLPGEPGEFYHQETKVLFGQFPGWRGPRPAWSHPSPPWTRRGTCPNAPRTEPGWKQARQARALPTRSGQSRAEPDTGGLCLAACSTVGNKITAWGGDSTGDRKRSLGPGEGAPRSLPTEVHNWVGVCRRALDTPCPSFLLPPQRGHLSRLPLGTLSPRWSRDSVVQS